MSIGLHDIRRTKKDALMFSLAALVSPNEIEFDWDTCLKLIDNFEICKNLFLFHIERWIGRMLPLFSYLACVYALPLFNLCGTSRGDLSISFVCLKLI